MSPILLDTNVFLWLQTDPGRLGDVLATLEDPEAVLLLSAATSWELAVKFGLGKLPLPQSPADYVIDRAHRSGMSLIDVTHADALAVAELPQLHRDPFDRLLVAQAQNRGCVLMTGDTALAGYPVETLVVGQ